MTHDIGKLGTKAIENWIDDQRQTSRREIGLYEAEVIDDRDPHGEGKLFVSIPGLSFTSPQENRTNSNASLFTAYPMFPSWGSNVERDAAENGWTSYGMFGPQPRKGDIVICSFTQNGFQRLVWLGCMPRTLSGYMIPGVPNSIMEDGLVLPGLEKVEGNSANDVRPPAMRFADNLQVSGLVHDGVRGAGDTGKTRESPSLVSGIKTAGIPSLGHVGHQLALDDRPESSGVRLRTSSGHQILLSDSTQSIYISTSKGGNWIELSEDGKIDIYSKDDIAIHTEKDFSLTANNINIEAKSNMNFKVGSVLTENIGSVERTVNKSSKTRVMEDFHLSVDKTTYLNSLEDFNLKCSGTMRQSSENAFNIRSNGGVVFIDGVQDARINENGSALAIPAEDPLEITLATQSGPPTQSQIDSNQQGSGTEYISGARIPQHEPWKPEGRYVKKPVQTPGHLSGKWQSPERSFDDRLRDSSRDTSTIIRPTTRPPVYDAPYPPGSWRDNLNTTKPSTNYNRYRTNYIMIHHTASVPTQNQTITDIWNLHVRGNNWNDIGYHYVIERDGARQIGVPENKMGRGAAGFNDESIHIALVGGAKPGTNGKRGEINFTTAQWITLKAIVEDVARRHPSAKVIGHRDVDRAKPEDPAFDAGVWYSKGMPAISDYPSLVLDSWSG